MKPGPFRFETLLLVYQSQEEVIMQEISLLEQERKAIEQNLKELLDRCQEIRDGISEEGEIEEAAVALRCINGLLQKREQSKVQQEELGQKILQQREELMKVRQERMRFRKLKERHQEECQRYLKLVEQKESDDFAQRKRDR